MSAFDNRKKPKPMPDTSKSEMTVDSVNVDKQEGGDQVLTLVLRYSGTLDLSQKIIQGQTLSVELPSHAPPA